MVILKVLATLLVIDAALVLGTYAIWVYETGNRRAPSGQFGEAGPGERICGIAGEILASFCSLVVYPLGYVIKEAPARFAAGERPLILCHGYMHNRSAFLLLRRRLSHAGRKNVIAPNFRPASGSVAVFARQLSETARTAMARAGCNEVDLVGHSMGGLVVRYFIEHLDGRSCVRAAVTVGTPNVGTKMAALGLFPSSKQFSPGSEVLAGLSEPLSRGGRVAFTALWSEFDNMVLPPDNAKLSGLCRNVMIRNTGHIALLFSKQVFREVLGAVNGNP